MSGWVQHEAGWYSLRGVGGICHESDGWTFWPLGGGNPIRGLASLRAAKRAAILRTVYPDALSGPAAGPTTSKETR